ncbi:MAG: glutamine-hydrolyzing GMP synthase [Nitrososphaerales archaeon]|nr:glutamine-hydrolyzing GMP synthase [Nitrososphaerales archaeon]
MAHQSLEGGIAVLDFGGQYSHLICRRVRALGVYATLLPFDTGAEELATKKVAGVILSGGPSSVYDEGAPHPDPRLFDGGIPVLGICYGYQLMIQAHGGEVQRAERREYGRASVRVVEKGEIFAGLKKEEVSCWMSHGDSATRLPGTLRALASSEGSPYAAVSSADGRQLGVQFHPEVSHTEDGELMISNFVLRVCGALRGWTMEGFLKESVGELSRLEGRVLCAVSGGVDSAVTAILLQKAVDERLECVFIDTGLLRAGEAEAVEKVLSHDLGIRLSVVDASEAFLGALKGVADPEQKRRVVGKVFADRFEAFARKNGPFAHLAQGTLYPDVIESGRSGAPASVIKTHHNVGGLPSGLSMAVVEPLRDLYKDEVRKLGAILGLPQTLLQRHPFPGPGLAVRIVGEVTPEKLRVCREANRLVEEVLMEKGVHSMLWQAFAYVGDDLVTGVLGDERRLGYQVSVKAVESVDGMTADWYRMPHEVMERVSSRITNEVEGVVAVSYVVSSKPPATIEPQ